MKETPSVKEMVIMGMGAAGIIGGIGVLSQVPESRLPVMPPPMRLGDNYRNHHVEIYDSRPLPETKTAIFDIVNLDEEVSFSSKP